MTCNTDARLSHTKNAAIRSACNGAKISWWTCKRYKDSLKTRLKACVLDPHKIEELAQDRSSRRTTYRKAIEKFETDHIQTLEIKREIRKEHAIASSASAPSIAAIRSVVPRASSFSCFLRIGLYSNMRRHR